MWLFFKLRYKLYYLDREKIALIYKAFRFARACHKGQMRHSGIPYITHPVEVALILSAMKLDYQTIAAALLHDVIEDTEVEKEVIAERFGEPIAMLVDGVSKLTRLNFKNREEEQAAYLRKMFLATASDVRIFMIKLADRLHNMRTLESLPPEKQRRKAEETLTIYVPVANRFGMHEFAMEMEDLSFTAKYPLRSKVLAAAVEKAEGERAEQFNQIKQDIKEVLARSPLVQYEVKGRRKQLYSIYKKMRDKKLLLSEILDVYAFRVLLESVDDCYRCLGVTHQLYVPFSERFKDYIANSKANKYQSLHTTLFGPNGVPVEVQIRTYEMDRLASHGLASHWLYKVGEVDVSQAELIKQEWLQNLLDMWKLSGNSVEFIENVKMDLFPNTIYIFTPQGEVRELPQGSSVLDFAYAVHTDIGENCVAARVDRHLVPLSTILSSGQTVEVITSPEAKPEFSWLKFVVTGKARSKVSNYLKHQRRKQSIILGESLFQQILIQQQVALQHVKESYLKKLFERYKCKTIDDLYETIGLGYQEPEQVVESLLALLGAQKSSEDDKAILMPELIIGAADDPGIKMANCCYPVPGDKVLGVMTPGLGMTVHVAHCKKIGRVRQQGRMIPLRWSDEISSEFPVELKLVVEDKIGSLNNLTSILAASQVSIIDLDVRGLENGFAEGNVKVWIKDRLHLAKVLRLLRRERIVIQASRHCG